MPATCDTERIDVAAVRRHREPIRIQSIFGSKPRVDDVYCYDAYRKSVFVKFAKCGDDLPRPACVQLIELEAWDADNRSVDVEQAVLWMVEAAEVFE